MCPKGILSSSLNLFKPVSIYTGSIQYILYFPSGFARLSSLHPSSFQAFVFVCLILPADLLPDLWIDDCLPDAPSISLPICDCLPGFAPCLLLTTVNVNFYLTLTVFVLCFWVQTCCFSEPLRT